MDFSLSNFRKVAMKKNWVQCVMLFCPATKFSFYSLRNLVQAVAAERYDPGSTIYDISLLL